jgi:hypothetical protein
MRYVVLAILIAMFNACASDTGGSSPGSSSSVVSTADTVSGSDTSASAEVSTPATKKCTLDKTVEGVWTFHGINVWKSEVVFNAAKCQITVYEFGKTKNDDHTLFIADPWDIKEKSDTFIKVIFPGNPPDIYTLTRPVQ